MSIFAPAAEPGNLAFLRSEKHKLGMIESVVSRLGLQPAALVTSDPDSLKSQELPVLHVADPTAALMAMGNYARDRMTGNVLAVTGSAGKTTTVAMLAAALEAYGGSRQTRHNANLPMGVAWNMASIPWDTPNIVLELAIGRMAASARIARPDLAIFTNILPAHLGESSTLKDIAETKSAIFRGMSPGSTTVLNRDMHEFETVRAAAFRRDIEVILYGSSEDCDARLLKYDAGSGEVTAALHGMEIRYRLGARGRHMAINSLAVLAAITALGNSCEGALLQLENFFALQGRGEESTLLLGDRRLRVIDDAYNANPGSMAAALQYLSEQINDRRRIAVLGEMAELGPDARHYHSQIADMVANGNIDRVYVTGELYADFWDRIALGQKGHFAASPEELQELLLDDLADGDVILFKGSNSTRIHALVAWLKEKGAPRLKYKRTG